jgi:CelD/BcsL family acetyltransferase involved in cellulose biosynthesis
MGPGSLEIRTYRSLAELERIRPQWNDLLESYSLATTFSTPEWLIPWWRNFAGNQKLLSLAFFAADSRLVGLALLSLSKRRVVKPVSLSLLRLMGDGSQDSDNLDIPVLPGFEQRVAESLIRFLKKGTVKWDFAEFNTMPPHSPMAQALRQLFAKNSWVMVEKQRPASVISLPSSWEEYIQVLSSEDRNNLVRYARRLEKRYAVRIYRCSSEEQLPRCLEALFAHHQARWHAAGEAGSFGSTERRNFYYELSRLLLKQDRLDLWALELDDEIAAAQFAFRYRDTVFQLQEGNNPKHTSDRVGFLLRGHVLKELIAQGVRTYDFLGGQPGYKSRWGAQAGHYMDFRFARSFTAGAAYVAGTRNARAAKEWLRRALPASAWERLRRANLKVRRRN